MTDPDGALRVDLNATGLTARLRVGLTEHRPGRDAERFGPPVFPDSDGSFATPSGVRGTAHIEVRGIAPGRWDVDVVTTIAEGSPEIGLRQTLAVALDGASSPAIYLPGIWVDGNPRTAGGAPSTREGDAWSFRDDRLAWPAAIAWDRSACVTVCLLRITPATRDVELPLGRGYRHRGAHVVDPSACDVGAMGFAVDGGETSLCAHLPFAELPKSYQDKRTLIGPIAAAYRAVPGTSFSASYRLIAAPAADAYEAIETAARTGIALWHVSPPDGGDRSVGRIKRSIAAHLRGRYFAPRGRRGVAGFYTFVETFGDRPVLGICEPAFTGKAFRHARNLLEHASATGDANAARMAERVLDTWLERATKDGLMPDFWCRELGWLPINRPFAFDPPKVQIVDLAASLRRLGESAIALLDASRLRPDKPTWKDAAAAILDRLAALQLPSGGFPRRVRLRDGAPLQADNLGATPTVCAALLAGYGALGNAAWLDAAVRCGTFLEREMIAPVRFHGSTLDADCEDKEAATETLAALRGLYEATGDDRWLDGARKVAWMSVFWFCLTDVPFPEGSMLCAWDLKTRGLTLVSTENNHVDLYLFSTPADLRWLAERLGGDDDLARVAWTALRSSLQLVATPAHPLEFTDDRGRTMRAPVGLVPEVLQHTLWVYLNKPIVRNRRDWIKGYADPKTSMWTSASVWRSLDAMREVVGDEEWNEFLEP